MPHNCLPPLTRGKHGVPHSTGIKGKMKFPENLRELFHFQNAREFILMVVFD